MKKAFHPDQAMVDHIQKLGAYTLIRVLEDGTIIGLGELAFTTALYWDLNLQGFERRYCFKDPALALIEYNKATNGEYIPEGWIATRPEPEGFYEMSQDERRDAIRLIDARRRQ